MKIERFEDINSWRRAKVLVLKVYKILINNKSYSFRDQIQRSAVSIMNNIAEGFERKSSQEFKYFLFIAKGSCAEPRSMLDLAYELNYLKKEDFEDIHHISVEISRLLSGLIKTL